MSSLNDRFSTALHATGRGGRQSLARGRRVELALRTERGLAPAALRRRPLREIDADRMALASVVQKQLPPRPGEPA
jgi:hypothetical protein